MVHHNKKIVFIGPASVGKTACVKRLIGSYTPIGTYEPTLGVEVHSIYLNGKGFNIWDCSGSYPGLADGYYIGADLFVIFGAAVLEDQTTLRIIYNNDDSLRNALDNLE